MELIVFEDEHLLVVNKPAGLNTHAPAPFASEGLFEWLKNREPRWSTLSILHRLDKETSGVMVFGKTPIANRSLTDQFAKRRVHKKYVFLTDRQPPVSNVRAQSFIKRKGDHYANVSASAGGDAAETLFSPGHDGASAFGEGLSLVKAEPLTGRTHQIRVHAAAHDFPILGDTLYGGTASDRVYLHAQTISFNHPATGQSVLYHAASPFAENPRQLLRSALIDSTQTTAYRMIHGAADGWPGLYIDKLGDFLLAQSERDLTPAQLEGVDDCCSTASIAGIYHKVLDRQAKATPQWLRGEKAPEEIIAVENGLKFALRFDEGYSVGLFLDQRDNRRRLLTRNISSEMRMEGGGEVLNAFAYTCGFSVAAAKGGARVTSLDLSKKYLDWGRRNFQRNGIDAAAHDFIYGDAFDWFRRLAAKKRLFDTIILDPPTFSRSKESGVFQAERDYGKLVASALPVLKTDGILLASCNTAAFVPEKFLESIKHAITQARRNIIASQYIPQPPDFPADRAEPAYLKTVWLRVGA